MWLGIFLKNSNPQNTDEELFLCEVAPLGSPFVLAGQGDEAHAAIAGPLGRREAQAVRAQTLQLWVELHSHTGSVHPCVSHSVRL